MVNRIGAIRARAAANFAAMSNRTERFNRCEIELQVERYSKME